MQLDKIPPLNLVFSGENRFMLDYSILNAVHSSQKGILYEDSAE